MNWTYYGSAVYGGTTYHIWSRPHDEGYTAYAVNHSKDMKPVGAGHYDSLESLERKTGLKVVPEAPAIEE